jgi:hypothetical protein
MSFVAGVFAGLVPAGWLGDGTLLCPNEFAERVKAVASNSVNKASGFRI